MRAYVELHCHSNYSLLDGASHPEDLVKQAALLGMDALALTDHDALYGAVRFDRCAREQHIRPIFGAEITFVGGHHLTLLVENEAGWQNLCWLITSARHNATKGSAALPPEMLDGHTKGLIALSGCRQGEIASALLRRNWQKALQTAYRLRDLFGREHFWIELQHHLLPEDDRLVYKLVSLARRIGVGYVATNNVHYTMRDGHCLQDVLVCIRHGQTLENARSICRPNSEYYLKSSDEMSALFAAYPAAVTNTRRIAERCQFSLHYGLQDLPAFPTPEGLNAISYLRQLCEDALPIRLPNGGSKAYELLAHELDLIGRSGLANYFLIVWDLVRYARENDIRCQGRGSASNSLVAYLLGISPINPLAHHLLFERFLSEERQATPDIDIDFQANRREEVIQYVYSRYGHAHAAMACTLVTFRSRSALREVGKVLGLPPEALDRQANAIDDYADPRSPIPITVRTPSPAWQQLRSLYRQIIGFPRHLGIHNGGMVVFGPVLSQRLPTEPAAMPGRVVVQWDKDSLEDAGLVKIDLLGLRMLSVIADTVASVEWATGIKPDLDALTPDDPAVYDMIVQADTVGVFQVESRAQAQVLPRLQPRRFEDIIISISLIRPGPIQGNMVHPYLRRRLGEEPVTYLHPLLKPALEETLGVILWQETVLKVARDFGRFTAGQGELLRRTLGKKDNETEIARFQAAFTEGAMRNGASEAVAGAVFAQLKAFGGYSFPKSHAAAFAVLVYQSAWLKCYYPAHFVNALLRNQPMGFWSPAVLINDAKRHGITVLPVDIHRSMAACTIEEGSIRLGFNYVHGVGDAGAARLVEARVAGDFVDLADFCRRVPLSRKVIERLILVGAMDSWNVPRRQLLWQLGTVYQEHNALGLIFTLDDVDLPPFSHAEMVYAEYEILGLSVGDHVMALYRPLLAGKGILSSRELSMQPDNATVQVAGQVIMHQAPPTAKGHHFITLEDEEGMVNVIVRPDVYANYSKTVREASLLIIGGVVQHKGGVVNLVAQKASHLSS